MKIRKHCVLSTYWLCFVCANMYYVVTQTDNIQVQYHIGHMRFVWACVVNIYLFKLSAYSWPGHVSAILNLVFACSVAYTSMVNALNWPGDIYLYIYILYKHIISITHIRQKSRPFSGHPNVLNCSTLQNEGISIVNVTQLACSLEFLIAFAWSFLASVLAQFVIKIPTLMNYLSRCKNRNCSPSISYHTTLYQPHFSGILAIHTFIYVQYYFT